MRARGVNNARVVVLAALALAVTATVGLSGAARAAAPAGSPALKMFTEQLPIPPEVDARAGGAFGLDELVGTHVFGTLTSGQPLPATPSFGFWPSGFPAPDNVSFPYLGPTIEARRGNPLSMTVTNKLYQAGQDPSAPAECQALGLKVIHPLAGYFDTTIEGTELLNECAPATATHLHGGHTPVAFDGEPTDIYRPAIVGDSDDYGAGTGSFTYEYPNDQEATTLWYHDHALADTRFNPMAGLAAFYLIRDQWDTGRPGNPLGLPANGNFDTLGSDGDTAVLQPKNPYEIPIVLQDRQFNADGSLWYPTQTTADHPIWAPESFNDVATVNGKAWPNLNVDRGLYRFRLLDGSNARFYNLTLVDAKDKIAPIPIYVIGSDGGLLNAPVSIKSLPGASILIAPGERYDLLVDFRNAKAGVAYRWMNNAAAPYPMGSNNLKPIMQFTVGSNRGFTGPVPTLLRGQPGGPPAVPAASTQGTAQNRTVFLNEVLDQATGNPVDVLLNNLDFMEEDQTRFVGIERPKLNTSEVWTIVNTTGDAHPIHLHLTQFQILNRQKLNAAGYLAAVNPQLPFGAGGTGVLNSFGTATPPDPAPYLRGQPTAPDANETGWNDTVRVYPGELVRIVAPFGGTAAGITAAFEGDAPDAAVQRFVGTYVWHCHILEHEENDMMLPYTIEQ
jgi:spore coat protein A, manganese oxidase